MTHRKRLLISALASLASIAPLHFVRAASPTITLVVTTYDYPGVGTADPFGINSRGDVAASYLEKNASFGFIRYSDGTFSAPIADPEATGHVTNAEGINRSRVIDGSFFNRTTGYQGFILAGSTFHTIEIGISTFTFLFGINDAGDIAGEYVPSGSDTPFHAYARIAGTDLDIMIPGQTSSEAHGLNNLDQVAGDYTTDGGFVFHGFIRQADGTLTFPIDYPGAVNTFVNGINDQGWIVGTYELADGHEHGFFLKLPNTFVSFDYPAAGGTSLVGINNSGMISGRYLDTTVFLPHGFIAQVSR